MKILLVGGARPNFMKIAPIYRESLNDDSVQCILVHTGQHYDYEMSQSFFDDLGIPRPQFFLEAGSGSHAVQTAKVMVEFEKVCQSEKPDLVMVVGDVNSTLACSIVAKKLLIDVAHVEAGLRSFDQTMPEEINRMVTDAISDYFFVTEESAIQNLLREGKPAERIYHVGNVMIDNLLFQLSKLNGAENPSYSICGRGKGEYYFLTLHRPSNVDKREKLLEIVGALKKVVEDKPIIFPVHPRTRKMLEEHQISLPSGIFTLPPLGFMDSLRLWKDAAMVLTDSGGLQEETTALGLPCLTIRDNTERPVTISHGSNHLGGTTAESILVRYEEIRTNMGRRYSIPPNWDGKASERIWQILRSRREAAHL